jgi:spermidine synthase
MVKSTILQVFSPQLIESVKSNINGTIEVYKHQGKIQIVVDDLTQSGGLVQEIWAKVVKHLSLNQFKSQPPPRIIVLGMGAGSQIESIFQTWPQTAVTAIEIDPVMIELGHKYFNLKQYSQLSIINTNAFSWLEKNQQECDLILVDLYLGKAIPKPALNPAFFHQLKDTLSENGHVVLNHTITKDSKPQLFDYHHRLDTVFTHVSIIPTPANKVFLVSK